MANIRWARGVWLRRGAQILSLLGTTFLDPVRFAAAAPQSPELTLALRQILGKHLKVPALWGATVDRGQRTALGVAGVRKRGEDVPATTGDQVHLGSDTKAMTAVLVGQFVQARRLNWSDTMGNLFPDLRPTMNGSMAAVTVANLLRHTAGLPHDLNWHALDVGGQTLMRQRLAAVGQALYCVALVAPNRGFAVLAAANAAGDDATAACDEVASTLIRLHARPAH